jgi:hypothetical protein
MRHRAIALSCSKGSRKAGDAFHFDAASSELLLLLLPPSEMLLLLLPPSEMLLLLLLLTAASEY